jgi:type IV pilus assembly protein PilY1
MTYNQNKYFNFAAYASSLALMLSLALPLSAKAAPLDLATIPLANSNTVPIKSNLLFIFDDSGSMDNTYMPDDSSNPDVRVARNAAYNTIYYNPANTYLPPANFTAAGIDTATYPSQTGAATANGASAAAKPNWIAVERDAYGVLSTSNDNLTNDANYFTVIPGEYCTKGDLKVCNAQAAPSAAYPIPAPVRWCNGNANALAATPAANICQGFYTAGTFDDLRIPSQVLSTITFSTNGSRTITKITVGGQQIMSAATVSTGGNNNASQTAARINACTAGITGQCQVAGYSATASNNVITISAPAVIAIPATPVVTASNTTNAPTVTAFAKNVNPLETGTNNAPGQTVYVSIQNTPAITPVVSPVTTFAYPGSAAKAPTRSDCSGTRCTYVEEMTNYANWYTYYRTRAQMMKTATSLAFKDIGDDFKIGYMTTSGASNRARNFATFTTANKALWYSRLFSTVSDTFTPLRGALSTAGRIYATRENLNGVFTDPIEYECQQNFALLTTDGAWNANIETPRTATAPANVPAVYGPFNLAGGNVDNLDAAPASFGIREGTAVSNTLADVARYYRVTDLRTTALGNCTGALGSGVCETPSASASPINVDQNMVTFTLGLGVDGTLSYVPNYESVPGDYLDIKINKTKTWPDPFNSGSARTDDLWHAAVNGGGTYFSAKTPADVVSQLREALASIKVKVGTGAAAAASSLSPVNGDNFSYVASYVAGNWVGNLERRTIDPDNGKTSLSATHSVEDILPTDSCAAPSAVVLNDSGSYDCVTTGVTDPGDCAVALDGTDCKIPVTVTKTGTLKLKVSAFSSIARNIKMNVGGVLQDFAYTNLTATQKLNFDTPWLTANLTQWPTLTAGQIANATGANLVGYLRGETGFDQRSTTFDNRVFRKRQATLGDLIHSTPTYYSGPELDYTDPGYQAYKAATAQVNRANTVFVGANDGMLHAFNADTLEELWAYVPTMVIPNMWKLADSNYSAKHAYYVDGDIVVTDVCTANCGTATATWKTILVAGLGGGGRGYFALDVTNPSVPLLLWEFNPASTNGENVGYSYGNPIVTKRNIDDKWVVLFTSGHNNIPDNSAFYSLTTTSFKPNNPAIYTTGNGGGYLYVLDAVTGNRLNAIPTLNSSSVNVGNATTPSGLGRISAITDDTEINNVTTYVYGGDLLGNLWRFNIDTNQALNFAQLRAGATAQPITTAPEIASVNNKDVIYVGTGKYLEVADLTNTNIQTMYAIEDDNATATLVNPRATLVKQTIVADPTDTDSRLSGSANSATPFQGNRGWYVDFPDARERLNIDPTVELGTLLAPTTVPEESACQPAGFGWFNYLDYATGVAVVNPASNSVSTRLTAPSAGFNVFSIKGKPVISNSGVNNPNPDVIDGVPFNASGIGFQKRRSIWREIIE